MDQNDLFNPTNSMSPLCPLNPTHPLHDVLFHSMTQPAPNQGFKGLNGINLETNTLTWILIIAALILAGIALWPVFK